MCNSCFELNIVKDRSFIICIILLQFLMTDFNSYFDSINKNLSEMRQEAYGFCDNQHMHYFFEINSSKTWKK